MDTETYSNTLHLVPSTTTTRNQNDANATCTCTNSDDLRNTAVLQQRLDEMQRKWKLANTAVPRLLGAIHRLAALHMSPARVTDSVMKENNAIHEGQSSSTLRIQKLEAAVSKLHKKNQRLKEKLQSKKSENTSQSYVRDFAKQEIHLDDQRLASQLEAHERVMLVGNNRSRTSLQKIMN
eukprot:scaffold5152_cov60-Attheya_sp.AAC.4